MALSKQEAINELARRGLNPDGTPMTKTAKLPITKVEAIAELRRRGLSPEGTPIKEPTEPWYTKAENVINSFGLGTAQNMADVGTGAINLAHHLIPAIPHLEREKLRIPQFAQKGIIPWVKTTGEIADPIAWMMPEVRLGEAAGLGLEGAGLASRLGARALSGGATGGLYGAVLAPEQQAKGAAIGGVGGAALSTFLGAPGEILGAGLRRLATRAARPGSLVRTPEEVAAISKALIPAEGRQKLPISFGDIANIPGLSELYHDTLAAAPLSGARAKGAQTLDSAREHAQNIINSLRHNVDPVQMDKHLLAKVKENYQFAHDIYGGQYNNLYGRAENLNLKPDVSYLKNAIKDTADKEMPIDEYLPSQDLKRVNDISKGTASFRKIRNVVSLFGKNSFEAVAKGDRKKASVYASLKESLNKSIQESIKKSKNPGLIDELREITKGYKKYVVPYQASDITRLRYKTIDPDKINNILLKGENLPVVGHMAPEDKDILAYKQFYNALEEKGLEKEITNPFKLINYYDRLSPKQREALFGGRQIDQEFNKLRALTNIAREPALKEARPYTGARLVGKGMKYLPAFLGGGAMMAPSAAPVLAGIMGGSLGATRGLTSALTSDWLRNAYITGKLPKGMLMRPAANALTRLLNLGVAQNLQSGSTQ